MKQPTKKEVTHAVRELLTLMGLALHEPGNTRGEVRISEHLHQSLDEPVTWTSYLRLEWVESGEPFLMEEQLLPHTFLWLVQQMAKGIKLAHDLHRMGRHPYG